MPFDFRSYKHVISCFFLLGTFVGMISSYMGYNLTEKGWDLIWSFGTFCCTSIIELLMWIASITTFKSFLLGIFDFATFLKLYYPRIFELPKFYYYLIFLAKELHHVDVITRGIYDGLGRNDENTVSQTLYTVPSYFLYVLSDLSMLSVGVNNSVPGLYDFNEEWETIDTTNNSNIAENYESVENIDFDFSQDCQNPRVPVADRVIHDAYISQLDSKTTVFKCTQVESSSNWFAFLTQVNKNK